MPPLSSCAFLSQTPSAPPSNSPNFFTSLRFIPKLCKPDGITFAEDVKNNDKLVTVAEKVGLSLGTILPDINIGRVFEEFLPLRTGMQWINALRRIRHRQSGVHFEKQSREE